MAALAGFLYPNIPCPPGLGMAIWRCFTLSGFPLLVVAQCRATTSGIQPKGPGGSDCTHTCRNAGRFESIYLYHKLRKLSTGIRIGFGL